MDKNIVAQCSQCGHSSTSKFENDICPVCGLTYWKCSNCGYLLTAKKPPETCTSCNKKCNFINVTCYTPECGGPGNIDSRL